MNNADRGLSILQFLLSGLAVLCLVSLAFIITLIGMVEIISSGLSSESVLPVFLYAAAAAAIGLLLVPSVIYSLFHLRGRSMVLSIQKPSWIHPILLVFVLPAIVLSGYYISGVESVAWFILPVLHVFAVGLPVLWFLYLGVRDLPTGTPQRRWGVFGSGLVLGPTLIMMVEIIVGLVIFLGLFLYVSSQPELFREIYQVSDWVLETNPQPEQILERVGNYLLKPGILFTILLFGGLIVPLIEEAIKPIGVWLLAGRNLVPVEGFTAGILSGAGYAFFESLVLTGTGEEWAVVVVARIGTAVIHILTTGLMGFALVSAWRMGKYLRLGMTYLGVVLLHGLWNSFAIFSAVALLPEELGLEAEVPVHISKLGELAPFILGLATAGAFVGLIAMNRYMAQHEKSVNQLEQKTALTVKT